MNPPLHVLAVLALGALAMACASEEDPDPTGPVAEGPGALEATVVVGGSRPDPDGYSAVVSPASGGEPKVEQVDAAGGTIRFPNLPPGSHSILLEDLDDVEGGVLLGRGVAPRVRRAMVSMRGRTGDAGGREDRRRRRRASRPRVQRTNTTPNAARLLSPLSAPQVASQLPDGIQLGAKAGAGGEHVNSSVKPISTVAVVDACAEQLPEVIVTV